MAKFSTFIYHSGILYGATQALDSITPDRGPTTGGTEFVLAGAAFLFPTYDDYFIGAVLDTTKWTDISDGDGTVLTGASHLVLDTGATAGSIAGIDMDYTARDSQFEARVNIPVVQANPASVVNMFTFRKYVDANNYATLAVNLSALGVITLDMTVVVGARRVSFDSIAWTTGISTFKILQWGTDLYFYANGILVFKSDRFINTVGAYGVFATNVAATYTISNVVVEYILSRPFATFDTEVVHDLIVVSDVRARGLTPPSMNFKDVSAAFAGLVDVSLVSSSVSTKTDAFEYYFEDRLTMVDNSQFAMKISDITELTVRTPILANKGLGSGK
jgi:hypothetical protein